MKKLILTTAIIAFSTVVHAQTPLPIEISYDAAGNRIMRKVLQISMKSLDNSRTDSTYYFDQMQSVKMMVYPNPTQGKIFIDMPEVGEKTSNNIRVFDSQGRMIFEKKGLGNRMELDISTLSAGYYIIELFANDEHTTWKIIKK